MQDPNPEKKYPLLPYDKWAQKPHKRWVNAGNTFGIHLIQHVRDTALREIAPDASEEIQEAARKAVDDTLFSMMDFLDGCFVCEMDEKHTMTYSLSARIRDETDKIIETIELAPDGDGLAMGYVGWREGNFGQQRAEETREE